MFHTKQDVDRHVNEVFKNIKSEYQRNLKCYQIAKLYYKFNDYNSAIKYINRYILTTSNSAAAHKLLGECFLGLNLKLKALDSFKTSLELNGSQQDLVLKICSLIMDSEVSAVMPKATYWLERAEALFPTSPVVFRLREHLLKTNLDGKQDNRQLEKLILSEVSARPTDVTVRIRLLNFFIDTHRYKVAYQHALEIEDRSSFPNDPRWYDCLCNLVQAYEKAMSDLTFNFFIKKIIFFERRADLFLQEFQDKIKTLSACSAALFEFDQSLHSVSKIFVPPEEAHFFAEFMKHMRTQLSFHLATLALKRAKTEYGIWPKAFRTASPLLLQATQNTMDLEDAWYITWAGKNKLDKEVKQLNKSAALRISQAGHILLAWSQNKAPQFLEKVSQFCGGKWQNRAYQDVFYNKNHQLATATSCFINDPFFSDVPLRFLSEAELNRFDEVAQTAHPESLHLLVWLGLANCNANGQLNHYFRCTTMPDLKFTVDNLSQTGPETLNQLDVDAFLYASVLCAKSAMSNTSSTDRPSRLPVSISEELCSPAQAEWWSAVHKMYKNQSNSNIGDLRLKLKKGIETIRAYGQHDLHVKLIVMLAKLFQERATKNKNTKELNGLEERAYFYWSVAIPLLERIEKNQQTRDVGNRLFDYRGKDLTPNEIKGHLEDGRLFLGCRLMKQGRYEQAIEAFQALKSPYASFYQGLIYKKLASEEVNDRPESITSENRSQHIILLTRAREALYLTLDRLRCPSVDPNHPLNGQLQDDLEEIEKQLAIIDPDNSLHKNGDTESDGTDTAPGLVSPDVDDNLDTSFNVFNANNLLTVKPQGTPRIPKRNISDRHLITRLEARPSPERLEAQLRHLVQANSNGLQAVVEQLKEMKAVMQIELKDLGCVTRDLLAEMKRWNDRAALRKGPDSIKAEELFDLREEDYDDLTQFSQPCNPYQNYHLNRQMASTQINPPQPYGASVPSPIPPVPPVIPNQENPLLPHTFYQPPSGIPPIDPSVLYQSLGFYPQNLLYGENQNVPDYRGMGIQKGAPFTKNSYRAPDNTQVPIMSTTLSNTSTTVKGTNTKTQPPNVVITSSDTLPVFTSSAGTPTMSVTIPPQHIKSATFQLPNQKPNPNQVHPFQIQMPPQAQLVKESPTDKLNSIIPSVTTTATSIQTTATIVPPTIQITPNKDTVPLKDISPVINNVEKTKQEFKTESNVNDKVEEKLFDSKAKLSLFANNEWKDKRNVSVKIFQDKVLNKARIICQEPFCSLIDHFIDATSSLEKLKNKENSWVCVVNNLQKRNQEAKPFRSNESLQKFCLIFYSVDEAKDFEHAFKQGLKIVKKSNDNTGESVVSTNSTEQKTNLCSSCGQLFDGADEKCSVCVSKDNEKQKLGGFTFLSKPVIEPPASIAKELKEEPKEAPAKSSPFANLSFTTNEMKMLNSKKLEEFKNSSNPVSLFAAVESDPNAFKKPKNFTFEGQNSLVFGNLNKTKPSAKTPSKDEEEGGDDDFVPTAEFAPVVDLPELVDLRTGEENDEVLFDEKAKLLRFDTKLKEWKERGVGNMKLLLNKESGKVRLIMRRELVLKVCCNHYLDEKMEFKVMTKSKNAVTWYAKDYSEGDFTSECFALRLKTENLVSKFLSVIENTQSKMKNGRMEGMGLGESKEEKKEDLKPLSELFKPKSGQWECEVCLIRNEEANVKCVSCETPKPGSENAASAATETTQPKGLGKGIVFPPTTMVFTFGIPNQSVSTSSINTSSTADKLTSSIPQTNVPSTNPTEFVFGIPNSGVQTTNSINPTSTFSLNPPTFTSTSSSVLNSTTKANVATTSTPATSFTFNFGLGSTAPTSSAPPFTKATTSLSTPTLSSPASSNLPTSSNTITFKKGDSIFGGESLKKSGEEQSSPFTVNSSEAEQNKSLNSISTPQTVFSFATVGKPEGKENFEFKFNPAKFSANETHSPKDDSYTEAGTSETSDVEQDADSSFNIKPIVSLPEKVDIPTGEEDEDVVYTQKAKLFRYCGKEWKERGIGELKILKHKTNNKIRLLMRRETILKVCLNHYVDNINFTKKDEKTWQWSSQDFSEGELKSEIFAMRFKNCEIANEFMKALEDVRKTGGNAEQKEISEAMKNFTFSTPISHSTTGTLVPSKEVQGKTSDDDISITYENTVTPEQRKKAISLQLPPKFYAYLQAPVCPGCEGCDKEDFDVPTVTSQQSTSTNAFSTFTTTPTFSTTLATSNTTVKPIFGNNSWGTFSFGADGTFKDKVLFNFAGNQAGKVTNNAKKSEGENDYIDDEDEDEDEECENEDYEDDDHDDDDEEDDDDDEDDDDEDEDEEVDDDNEDGEDDDEVEDEGGEDGENDFEDEEDAKDED